MSIWSDLEDRSSGEVIRKEDVVKFWEYCKGNPYKGVLDLETEKILSEIHSFRGFAPFLPADILVPDGKVQVFLDDAETRMVPVTLKQLEDERDCLKEEVEMLKNLVEELVKSLNVDQCEIEKLGERIKRLECKIKIIEETIKRMKAAGMDSIELGVKLLGYFVREKAEIHLMMGTIEKEYRSKGLMAMMTGIVFVHELMHAYFDVRAYVEHPHCRSIEEPIAEYGMLCFMEMFQKLYPGYAGILNTAKEVVEEKKYSLGVCNYGFGSYLFDDKTSFGVDWVSLFRSSYTSLLMNAPDALDYGGMISPIRYPLHERSCERKLYDVLKPRRFFYQGYKSCWRNNGSQLYFTIDKNVARSIPFKIEYPPKKKIQIMFINKAGTGCFGGEATVVSQGRFLIGASPLMNDYARFFGKFDHRPFAFYEEKPSDGIHLAEWVAIEM